MILHQVHFNRKFYQDKKTGYWISCDYPRTRAHRWVWINIHGNIPKGYHIHHKDENKSNNSIENLELIEKSRHLSIHMQCPIRKKKAAENCNRIRPLTKAWHASEIGKIWHKLHALQFNFGNRSPKTYQCDQCANSFESSKPSNIRFCSNACKSAWRRKCGKDNTERVCEICKMPFITNKYSKVKFCGRRCPGRHTAEKLEEKRLEKNRKQMEYISRKKQLHCP